MAMLLSHAVGPTEPPVRELTLGGLLAWAADTVPDRLALVTGTADPADARRRTYARSGPAIQPASQPASQPAHPLSAWRFRCPPT